MGVHILIRVDSRNRNRSSYFLLAFRKNAYSIYPNALSCLNLLTAFKMEEIELFEEKGIFAWQSRTK